MIKFKSYFETPINTTSTTTVSGFWDMDSYGAYHYWDDEKREILVDYYYKKKWFFWIKKQYPKWNAKDGEIKSNLFKNINWK